MKGGREENGSQRFCLRKCWEWFHDALHQELATNHRVRVDRDCQRGVLGWFTYAEG